MTILADDSASAREVEERETGRVEAFSDGVFAIAITLLVLNLHVPLPNEVGTQGLRVALGAQWPTYLAYLTSFVTILIMWVNHHAFFRLIARTDHLFLLWNGLLMLCITTLPFPTALMAEYLQRPDHTLATVIYAANMFLIAVAYNLVWRHASGVGELLSAKASQPAIRAITRAYRLGLLSYTVALALAFFNPWASIALIVALAIYYLLPHGSQRAAPSAKTD